jgi:uncharacterized protein YndB with AHSA1/START domain
MSSGRCGERLSIVAAAIPVYCSFSVIGRASEPIGAPLRKNRAGPAVVLSMIRFTFRVDVARPVPEVFAFVTDPARLPEWQGSDGVERLTPGPVRAGTRLREARALLGRRVESITEVTAYEPDRRFAIRILSGPAPVADGWAFEAIPGGTRVHVSTTGRAPRLLRPVEPLLSALLERRRREHHRRLREALERRSQPGHCV